MRRRHQIEVSGVDERGDDRATLGRAVAVIDRQGDVSYVEVEGVTIEQEKERRDEDEDEERPLIAEDLAQFLAINGKCLLHAALPPTFSTTSRKTSSSDG